MASANDPLGLLRDFVSKKRNVAYDVASGMFSFGEVNFHKDTTTAYRGRTGKEGYKLGACWFLLQNQNLKNADYLRECKRKNFPIVSLVDRQNLIEYLTGVIETSEYLVYEESAKKHVLPEDSSSGPDVKRRKVEKLEDVVLDDALKESKEQYLQRLEAKKGVSLPSRPLKEEELLAEKPEFSFVKADKEITLSIKLRERLLSTRLSMMQAPTKTFARVFDMVRHWDAKGPKDSNSSAMKQAPISAKRKAKGPPPIIVVPQARSALVNMWNVADLLQDGRFVPVQQKGEEGKKPEKIVINRRKDKARLPYEIVDDVKKLARKDWDRLIAVICAGPQWQFKEWKWKDQIEIFKRVKGFHIKFDDEAPHANIKKWDVSILNLSKHKRHLDQSTVHQFWKILDVFAAAKKSV